MLCLVVRSCAEQPEARESGDEHYRKLRRCLNRTRKWIFGPEIPIGDWIMRSAIATRRAAISPRQKSQNVLNAFAEGIPPASSCRMCPISWDFLILIPCKSICRPEIAMQSRSLRIFRTARKLRGPCSFHKIAALFQNVLRKLKRVQGKFPTQDGLHQRFDSISLAF